MLSAQLHRMLADPKSDQLVRNFSGQWLSVRDYGSMQPAAEYRNYDKPLGARLERGALRFFR